MRRIEKAMAGLTITGRKAQRLWPRHLGNWQQPLATGQHLATLAAPVDGQHGAETIDGASNQI